MNNIETQSNKGEIVMYQLNEMVKLDVRLEDETVWLTQAQMSQLFSVKEHRTSSTAHKGWRTYKPWQNSRLRRIKENKGTLSDLSYLKRIERYFVSKISSDC